MRSLMAIFPSVAEARAFEGLDAVVAWTGLRAEAWAAVDFLLGGCNGRTRNLALISAAVARCRTQPTAEDTKILYDLSNDVLEIAGGFEMAQLGQAASSLCRARAPKAKRAACRTAARV